VSVWPDGAGQEPGERVFSGLSPQRWQMFGKVVKRRSIQLMQADER
jgi:hypothetical protein